MITTSLLPNGDVLVTFMIDDERPVSVVGDFNGWIPTATRSSKDRRTATSPCLCTQTR